MNQVRDNKRCSPKRTMETAPRHQHSMHTIFVLKIILNLNIRMCVYFFNITVFPVLFDWLANFPCCFKRHVKTNTCLCFLYFFGIVHIYDKRSNHNNNTRYNLVNYALIPRTYNRLADVIFRRLEMLITFNARRQK